MTYVGCVAASALSKNNGSIPSRLPRKYAEIDAAWGMVAPSGKLWPVHDGAAAASRVTAEIGGEYAVLSQIIETGFSIARIHR